MLKKKLPLTIDLPYNTEFEIVNGDGFTRTRVKKKFPEPAERHSCSRCVLRKTNICEVMECFSSIYVKVK